jgi:hypothetical protein
VIVLPVVFCCSSLVTWWSVVISDERWCLGERGPRDLVIQSVIRWMLWLLFSAPSNLIGFFYSVWYRATGLGVSSVVYYKHVWRSVGDWTLLFSNADRPVVVSIKKKRTCWKNCCLLLSCLGHW